MDGLLAEDGHKEMNNRIDDPDSYEYAYIWLNDILIGSLAEEPLLRPSYTWGVLHAAHLARALDIPRVSVIEFGVAGGNGLIALELAAERAEKFLGVGIDVYGFDTGRGLPPPQDYRDLPNLFTRDYFSMDKEKLLRQLKRAKLNLGPVNQTLDGFIKSKPAPIGFISMDVDYYSSTMEALQLFETSYSLLLPRIYCYFDDIIGFTYSDFTGERLAISDFNSSHDDRKLSPVHGLEHFLPASVAQGGWPQQIYMAHFFKHPAYCKSDGLGARSKGCTDLKGTAASFLVAGGLEHVQSCIDAGLLVVRAGS